MVQLNWDKAVRAKKARAFFYSLDRSGGVMAIFSREVRLW